MDFERLSNEILVKIFSFFDTIFLYRSVSKVCKRWESLCSGILYSNCSFPKLGNKQADKNVSSFILNNNSYNITSVFISSSLLEEEYFSRVGRLNSLQKLCLERCTINAESVEAFSNNFLSSLNIYHLSLKLSIIKAPIFSALSLLQTLKYLHLHWCDMEFRDMRGESEDFSALIRNNKNLEYINMEELIILSDNMLKEIVDQHSDIKGIGIPYVLCINTETISYMLQKCKLLNFLHLWTNEVLSLDTLKLIFTLNHLKSFIFCNHNPNGNFELINEFFKFGSFKKLEMLELKLFEINDIFLFTIVQVCPNLITLRLDFSPHSNSEVTNIGLGSMIEGLTNIISITFVNLGVFKIDGQFLNHIPSSTSLKKLCLHNCKTIRNFYIQNLNARCPQVIYSGSLQD